jgi:hypothetical protein
MNTLDLPDLWRAAGLNVVEMDGWRTPRIINNRLYVWRSGDPVCSMWHHTATNAYTPNRTKANVWAGLKNGTSNRLYASGDGAATLVVANAYAAPVSSGYGQKTVIDQAAQDVPNDALARGPDDSPRWAANRSAWNTEVILDGVGRWIDPEVWDMLTEAANVMHSHMGWTKHRALGHAQFTGRKIDLRDGRDRSARETMIRFRNDMEDTMFTHYKIGDEYAEWETVSWWLYMLEGGTIDANDNSSQIQLVLPWKTNVRLVQTEDFNLIAEEIGLSNANRIKLTDDGLYRWGKELASLKQIAYTQETI